MVKASLDETLYRIALADLNKLLMQYLGLTENLYLNPADAVDRIEN